ncbi:hypothetical protein P4O66_015538 [Electrophorus voltai]|uniref:Uncharacterized protein n=1 Tax=Electrophorus voltai TaxID=2609070 RepID=A0AAD8Z129_9TELE|nr:hypothetical protein P4O66_015538 [Electrophorus voltai]
MASPSLEGGQPPCHRNIDHRRMPGKKCKKNKKGKKGKNRSSPALTEKPAICPGNLGNVTTGESAPRKFWGGPGCSSGEDSVESYRPLMDYENWYKGDQSWDYQESYWESEQRWGYMDVSLRSKCTDVSFLSDSTIHQVENPAVEMEEALYRDSLLEMDTISADYVSASEEPPAPKVPPKAPPRRCQPGISRLPNGACREASSSDEDTPPVKARSSRVHAPTPKPHKDKKAASPEPAPKAAQSAGAPPDACVPKME